MATTKAGITVEGAANLRRTLKAAGHDLTDLTSAHRQVGQFVTDSASPRAPRRSGALASSGRPGATQTAALIRYGGARVPYARPIHWGWPRRNISAQPWAYQTAIDTRPAWMRIYTAAVDKVLARIRGI
jgi:hypothetical protein